MDDLEFDAEQYLPRPRAEVFRFFSRAENLGVITPPWLGFQILSQSNSEIRQGTLIDYRIRLHGLPMRWRTLIEEWCPEERFVDTQLRGPYSKWHHTHTFADAPGGTLMRDHVRYQLPGGLPGRWLGQAWVRRNIEQIFEFRRSKITELFPPL
ncbi:MAG: SRPBCC family protein [Bacteriovoracia bacterium]